MNQNQLGGGLACRHLRMYQDLDARLGLVKVGVNREALLIQFAAPVIARDGEQMRIPKEWDEGPQ